MNNLSAKITELPSLENVIARKLLYTKIISRSVYSKRRDDRKKIVTAKNHLIKNIDSPALNFPYY